MNQATLSEEIRHDLLAFLKHSSAELLPTYLLYLEKTYGIHPVIYPKDRKIYSNAKDVVEALEKEGQLWKETEIKIGFEQEAVNEWTKKVYICPFTGKVFGDNTHPNPQDAIYDWVAKCPENTERVGGLRVKRFFVSEDPEMIKGYIQPKKEPIIKKVYSSQINGKLFSSPTAVIEDFKNHYLRPLSLVDVQKQSRYEIEEHLLAFFQEHLEEDKITAFVGALAEHKEFEPFVEKWVEG